MANITSRCPADHRCPLLRVCPSDAITQSGMGLPRIDRQKCIDCGICTRMCPYGAVTSA